MTLAARDPFPDGKIIVRLNHLYEVNQDQELSKPAIVNIADLFKNLNFEFNGTSLSLLHTTNVENEATIQPLQIKIYIGNTIDKKDTPGLGTNWLLIGICIGAGVIVSAFIAFCVTKRYRSKNGYEKINSNE